MSLMYSATCLTVKWFQNCLVGLPILCTVLERPANCIVCCLLESPSSLLKAKFSDSFKMFGATA